MSAAAPEDFDWEEWFDENRSRIEQIVTIEGYRCDSEARDECFVFTKINGFSVGEVGIDHLGRNPNDENVMYVQNVLTIVRERLKKE